MIINKITYHIALKLVAASTALLLFWACSAGIVDSTLRIRSRQVIAENADTVANYNVVAYLFIADTTTHYFTSFNEALSGKITNKANKKKNDYYLKGKKEDPYEYLLFPETNEKLVVGVVCDTVNKIYYYRNIATENDDVFSEYLYIDVIMNPYLFRDDTVIIDKQRYWIGQQ